MIYPYQCPEGHRFEVIKSLSEIDREERCECGEVSERQIGLFRVDKAAAGDWNRKEMNHALGVVATPQEARKLAKQRGFIEVGNEPVESVHKHFDKQRDDAYKAKWADDRVKAYD